MLGDMSEVTLNLLLPLVPWKGQTPLIQFITIEAFFFEELYEFYVDEMRKFIK